MIYMPAISMARHEKHARARYTALVLRGKAKKSALCALMRKVVQIAYGVITTNTVYDPAKTFPTFAGRLT